MQWYLLCEKAEQADMSNCKTNGTSIFLCFFFSVEYKPIVIAVSLK